MTSFLIQKVCGTFIAMAIVLSMALPAYAQNAVSVTLTPPLFQITIGPGESWVSSLKVVNNNPYDQTYYAQVVDMEANGEAGQSKFIPVLGESDPILAASQLARWVGLAPGPVFIKAGESANVPFTVRIPENAEPGGHYAAILVGTQPVATTTKASAMKISTYVSSLIFVRIKGEVIESGRIREFTTDHDLYQETKADFRLRLENTGNTHIKPMGDVTIFNMWGKERGKVLINQDANFGHVLPNSIRRFEFSWEGVESLFDLGRYSAVVTLSYGEEGKKSISATTFFWYVPLVPVSIALGSIAVFLLLLSWFIRRYIKRALMLERARLGVSDAVLENHVRTPILETIMEPIREGVVDLRQVSGRSIVSAEPVSMSEVPVRLSRGQFVRKYKLFFAFVVLLVIGIAVLSVFLAKVLVSHRDFDIKAVSSQLENAPQK